MCRYIFRQLLRSSQKYFTFNEYNNKMMLLYSAENEIREVIQCNKLT